MQNSDNLLNYLVKKSLLDSSNRNTSKNREISEMTRLLHNTEEGSHKQNTNQQFYAQSTTSPINLQQYPISTPELSLENPHEFHDPQRVLHKKGLAPPNNSEYSPDDDRYQNNAFVQNHSKANLYDSSQKSPSKSYQPQNPEAAYKKEPEFQVSSQYDPSFKHKKYEKSSPIVDKHQQPSQAAWKQGLNQTNTIINNKGANKTNINGPELQRQASGYPNLSYSSNFESARIESEICLEKLNERIKNEIGSMNYKIEMFNNRLITTLNHEFSLLRKRLHETIELVFEESERNIREYIKFQQNHLAGEILAMREALHDELEKVNQMKQDLSKANWKKITGELLASGLEEKIDAMLEYSTKLQPGYWESVNLAEGNINKIEDYMREIVSLRIS